MILISKTIPVILYDNLLTFRDTGKKLQLKRELLNVMNMKDYIDLAKSSDEKLLFEFAKEM